MVGEVVLCTLPSLDIEYNHVIDFDTIEERDAYIYSKRLLVLNQNIKYDSERDTLTIKERLDSVLGVDYLYITKNSKKYFYFVTNKSKLNDSYTLLKLQLDVWTTYLFDYKLLDSYVERCHQPRWNGDMPVTNTVDEGLPLGEYIQQSVENLHTYDNGLLIISTSPLGVLEKPKYGGTEGEGSSGTGGSMTLPPYSPGMQLSNLKLGYTPGTGTTISYGDFLLEALTTNITVGYNGPYMIKLSVYYKGDHVGNICTDFTINDIDGMVEYGELALDKDTNNLYIVTSGAIGTQHKHLVGNYTELIGGV